MITVTVSVISITAVIVGYAGVAAFTGAAKSKVSKCAASIKALIDVAANDDVVTMTFRYNINAKRCGSLIHLILMVDFGFWDM